MTSKIVQLNDLNIDRSKVIATTNGCFDLLHYGHIHSLQSARALSDFLIVLVNSDDSVRRLKGSNKPYNTEWYRAAQIASLQCVDQVIIFKEDSPEKALNYIKPTLHIKGSDYKEDNTKEYKTVIENGGKVVYVDNLACKEIVTKVKVYK